MWHTLEVSKIFEKMTSDYGYDLFRNRKQIVALCGDLLAIYEQENKIFQMLFHAGLQAYKVS